jgi:ribosomal-protein-alanine N-acetyltransferase
MEVFIETARLLLRSMETTDDQGMFELDSDPAVHKYLGNKPIISIDEARAAIRHIRDQYISNGIGRWAIVDKETNLFVGWGGFKLITVETNNHVNYHDLGYRLLRKHWGKGIASDITAACLDFGFQILKLDKIYAIADEKNLASQKVLSKSGFRYVEPFLYEGEPHLWFEIINPIT